MSLSEHTNYQVVARRYRPTGFAELIGQSQVATALTNAIEQGRVGHAYLFTGARGVGKTSSARIFAKCLNCVSGPTATPCGSCDICEGVSVGEDVDVLEIDGASNRGIDEIRQLRANANVRPGRARYKIYIIDEVHMLTPPAFNALLKTLEEPPAHVKFIFCTTDPDKIPITVLSRCQRFDFPPIRTAEIRDRLRHIVDQEKIPADDAALELLARRAAGSMRDSQSLLEQLLSFATDRITVADVHGLLGTADNRLVFELADAMARGEAATALAMIGEANQAGVDAGQLTSQLLGMFRDVMACHVGCGDELMLHTSADESGALEQLKASIGIESVMAILQVLDQTLVKLRHSTWSRTLLETAAVRCCHLHNLDLVPQLIEQLKSGPLVHGPGGGPMAASTSGRTRDPKAAGGNAKKKPNPVSSAVPADQDGQAKTPRPETPPVPSNEPWSDALLEQSWRNVLAGISDLTAEAAGNFDSIALDGDRLQITLKTAYDRDICARPEPKGRLEAALNEAAGKSLRLDFRISPQTDQLAERPAPLMMSTRARVRQKERDEFVRAAMDLFDGEILGVRQPPGGP